MSYGLNVEMHKQVGCLIIISIFQLSIIIIMIIIMIIMIIIIIMIINNNINKTVIL